MFTIWTKHVFNLIDIAILLGELGIEGYIHTH